VKVVGVPGIDVFMMLYIHSMLQNQTFLVQLQLIHGRIEALTASIESETMEKDVLNFFADICQELQSSIEWTIEKTKELQFLGKVFRKSEIQVKATWLKETKTIAKLEIYDNELIITSTYKSWEGNEYKKYFVRDLQLSTSGTMYLKEHQKYIIAVLSECLKYSGLIKFK